MSTTWILSAGVSCGLAALTSAALILWLEHLEDPKLVPRWLRLGLSVVASTSMFFYGLSLLGSLYFAMYRCISVLASH